MSIISDAATPKRQRQNSGPTLYVERPGYGVVADDESDDDNRYQLVERETDGERFVVVTRDDGVTEPSLCDALNRRNVNRHALSARDETIKSALESFDSDDDADAQRFDAAMELLSFAVADHGGGDALLDGIGGDADADALRALDAESLLSILQAETERVSKARKSLPRIDADRAGRVATAFGLYEAAETEGETDADGGDADGGDA